MFLREALTGARSIGHGSDAEDAAADAVICWWRLVEAGRLPEYLARPSSALGAYACASGCNRMKDILRRRRSAMPDAQPCSYDETIAPPSECDPFELVAEDDRIRAVEDAADVLREHRPALWSRALFGYGTIGPKKSRYAVRRLRARARLRETASLWFPDLFE